MTDLELARECGALVIPWENGTIADIKFTNEAQLSTFTERIRKEAFEAAAVICEERAGTMSMFANSRDARDHNATVRGCAAAIRARAGESQ